MAYDPTQNALKLATLLARADARQFAYAQLSGTGLVLGTHPAQKAFPARVPSPEPRYQLSWSAVYRGQRLHGSSLVVPGPLLALGEAAVLGEAMDAFDLTDLRLERLGVSPNTLSATRTSCLTSGRACSRSLEMTTQAAQGSTLGGTVIRLSGGGFARAVGVLFGDQPGVGFQVLHDATILVTSPPSKVAGEVKLTVQSVFGPQYDGVLPGGFTYFLPPTRLLSISPSSGPVVGGTLVTIEGISVGSPSLLQLGGVDIAVLTNDGSTITGTTGEHDIVGPVDLVIHTPNGDDTLTGAFNTQLAA